VRVECYSGRKADERPIRFQLDSHDYMVEEVLDQWRGPSDMFCKVRADDGNLYILRRDRATPLVVSGQTPTTWTQLSRMTSCP
jgi:hypothetical protein